MMDQISSNRFIPPVPTDSQKNVPKQTDRKDPETQFRNSSDLLKAYLRQNPLECIPTQEVHQSLVAMLDPEDYDADPETAVSLIVKPGIGRADTGILARRVLEIAGLGHTVPRASCVIASELCSVSKDTYKIMMAPDMTEHAYQERHIRCPVSLSNGHMLILEGKPRIILPQEGGEYKAVLLEFIVATDPEGKKKLIPSIYKTDPMNWENIPEDLTIDLPQRKKKTTFTVLGCEFSVRQESAQYWSVDYDPDELDEVDELLESDPLLWKVEGAETETYIPRLLSDPVTRRNDTLSIEQSGVHFPLEEGIDEYSLGTAKKVTCLVQEKVLASDEVKVSPEDDIFQEQVSWDALIDSVLSIVLICPQDSKATAADTNFLAVPKPDNEGYGIAFVDTDEAFPPNNKYSEAFPEHIGNNVPVLRPGLLAFDKTAIEMSGPQLSHAKKQIQQIYDKKDLIISEAEDKLSKEQVEAIKERIERLHTFLLSHQNDAFMLEDIVFSVFPEVKKDWDSFQTQGNRTRAQLAEWVGHITPAMWEKALSKRA